MYSCFRDIKNFIQTRGTGPIIPPPLVYIPYSKESKSPPKPSSSSMDRITNAFKRMSQEIIPISEPGIQVDYS